MRFRPPIGVERGPMSPCANDVLRRLINGTFEIHIERIADAILKKIQDDAAKKIQDDAAEVASTEGAQNRLSVAESLSNAR